MRIHHIVFIAAIGLAGCAKDASGPERPAKINIAGRWEGAFADGLLKSGRLDVTVIHDTVYGGVSGAGYLKGDTFEAVFTADGVVADSLVSMAFIFSGGTGVNFSGVVRGREMIGKVNGTGYVDAPIIFTRQ